MTRSFLLRILLTSRTVSSSWPTPRWLSISQGIGMIEAVGGGEGVEGEHAQAG